MLSGWPQHSPACSCSRHLLPFTPVIFSSAQEIFNITINNIICVSVINNIICVLVSNYIFCVIVINNIFCVIVASNIMAQMLYIILNKQVILLLIIICLLILVSIGRCPPLKADMRGASISTVFHKFKLKYVIDFDDIIMKYCIDIWNIWSLYGYEENRPNVSVKYDFCTVLVRARGCTMI